MQFKHPYNQLDHVPYGLNTWCCSQHTCQRRGILLPSLYIAVQALRNSVRNGLLLLALYHSKQVKVLAIVLLRHQERYNPWLSGVFWTSQLLLCSLSQLFLYSCAPLLECQIKAMVVKYRVPCNVTFRNTR